MPVRQNCLVLSARLLCLALLAFLASSCATIEGPANPDDPYESFNRSMFEFNDSVDRAVFKPVAQGYNAVMPDIASKGVTNFFNNLDDIVVFFNQIFQLKIKEAAATSFRLAFNSTFGLFGLIDVATPMGVEKRNEDFGQTLGYWGVGSGPYVVLPLIGPTTVRDAGGLAVDWTFFDPVLNRQTPAASLATLTIKYIDVRAGLLKASNILEDTVPDRYAFVRDAWLNRREFLVYDGNPPVADDGFNEDELFEDEDLFLDDLDLDSGTEGAAEQTPATTPDSVAPGTLNQPRMKSQMELMLEGGRAPVEAESTGDDAQPMKQPMKQREEQPEQ